MKVLWWPATCDNISVNMELATGSYQMFENGIQNVGYTFSLSGTFYIYMSI